MPLIKDGSENNRASFHRTKISFITVLKVLGSDLTFIYIGQQDSIIT